MFDWNQNPPNCMMASLVNRFLLVLVLAAAALLPGCASNKSIDSEPVKNAAIIVEGKHRGVTPATINVFRNRGEYEVKLMQGNRIVRQYEIGIGGEQRGPERHILDMDLERDQSSFGLRTFGLDDFESSNDTLYIIPYISQPIAVDDKEYGFTLVITDG